MRAAGSTGIRGIRGERPGARLGDNLRAQKRLDEAEELLGPACLAANDELGAADENVRPLGLALTAVLRASGQGAAALEIEAEAGAR